jgi:small conductance mechanosensitive channel
MIDRLIDFSGTVIAVGSTVLVILLGRFVLARSVRDKQTLPYHRQILTVAGSILGLFLAVALLPVSGEVRAQVLSVLGILLSAAIALSSTTFVGNAMAGIMLRLTRGFRAGDFVRFDDVVGRVSDVSLFHTEIQLITRDIVTVPNTILAQRNVQVTRRAGTFVNTDVSIGYTVPHGVVVAALLEAAQEAKLEEPFVLVEDLLDHAIRYRVYGLLEDASELLTRTSDLRKAVLNTLHRKDIEIASPGLTDRRSSDTSVRYIPPPDTSIQTEKQDIESIAFDRAEEAESIEALYAVQKKIEGEIKALGEARETDDPSLSSEERSHRKDQLKGRLKSIADEIARREEDKEKHRLEEEVN